MRARGTRPRIWLVIVAVFAFSVSMSLVYVERTSAGTSAPCKQSTVAIVAHPDDDLIFLNPDIARDIDIKRCVTVVFVTRGDAGIGQAYAEARVEGLLAAYSTMTNTVGPWSAQSRTVAGKTVNVRQLPQHPRLELLFLDLPDGNVDGSGFSSTGTSSLAKLIDGAIPSLTTVDADSTPYTRDELVAVLAGIMRAAHPSVVRTMNFGNRLRKGDHSDHLAVAVLAEEARALTAPHTLLLGYAGYPGADQDANVSGHDLTEKLAAFDAYAAHDAHMCSCARACSSAGRSESQWLVRQRVVARVTSTSASPEAATAPLPTTSGANVSTSSPISLHCRHENCSVRSTISPSHTTTRHWLTLTSASGDTDNVGRSQPQVWAA